MNSRRLIVLILIGCISLIAALVFFGRNYVLRQEKSRNIKGNLVYLQKAINAFAADKRKAGKSNVYPASLEELVAENYIKKEDLAELTSDAKVEYFKPSDSAASSTTILQATAEDRIFRCPLDGPVK